MSLLIPEIIIQDTVEAILSTIKANWDANADKSLTALYRMLNGVSHGSYNYYTQAQEVFLRTDANKRKITVSPNYPRDKKEYPCIVINSSNRSLDGPNSLGFDLDSDVATFDTDAVTFEQNTARSFSSTYSVLVISDNKNEVQLIYYVLEAFFIIKQIYEHLTLSGLENLKISGRELQMYDSGKIPQHFIRALQLNFFSQQVVDELTANSMLQNLTFNGLANNTLSLEGEKITGLSDFAYVGGVTSSSIKFTWTDNSDTTGEANGTDYIDISVFNSDTDEWVYISKKAQRVDATLTFALPTGTAFATGNNIDIYASFIRGDKQSTETEINTIFTE